VIFRDANLDGRSSWTLRRIGKIEKQATSELREFVALLAGSARAPRVRGAGKAFQPVSRWVAAESVDGKSFGIVLCVTFPNARRSYNT
jgi:hypothetical protein